LSEINNESKSFVALDKDKDSKKFIPFDQSNKLQNYNSYLDSHVEFPLTE
jgi:hypothetical protein